MTRRQAKEATPPQASDRTLPQNLEAERAVLGVIIIDNAAYERVATIVQPDHFYRDAHARIFRAMRNLDAKRVSIDFVTLKEELQRAGDLDEVGGPAYISALSDGLPKSTNVKYYAGIVREKFLLRSIIFAGNKTIASAYEGEDEANAILAAADKTFLDLQRHDAGDRLAHLRDSGRALMAEIEWRASHPGAITGIDTGFRELNAETSGWQAGEMIVIAARPSVGKTALAINTGAAAATNGNRVVVFSLEMRRKQLEYRLLASLSGVPLTRILAGQLGAPDYPKLSAAFEAMHDLDIIIDDRADQTAQDIRTTCRRLRAEGKLDLVIVDYFQLMQGNLDRKGATRTEELADISRRMKRLADELSLPVLVLSQLRRLSGARPQLEDLRECGALEQDCDIAVLLHRKNHREGGLTEAILAKQRNGPTGTVLLSFERDTVTFTDAPEGAFVPPVEDKPRPSTRQRAAMARRRRGPMLDDAENQQTADA